MTKKYDLKIIDDGEKTHMTQSISGFSGLEVIGLLSMRIAEIQSDIIKEREENDNTNKT
ncbi:MAG: hypothetical protein ACPH15_05810 [Pseudomonadales bacterium]